MALTEARILECKDDDELFELLGLELTAHVPKGEGETEEEFEAFGFAACFVIRALALHYH